MAVPRKMTEALLSGIRCRVHCSEPIQLQKGFMEDRGENTDLAEELSKPYKHTSSSLYSSDDDPPKLF